MKLLKCEVCGSSDLTKSDGVFVCDYCGAKYTLQEVQGMISAKTEVSGSVSIDNSSKTEAYVRLAHDAYADGQYRESEQYVSKALESDPSSSDAWYLKAMLTYRDDPSQAERYASSGDSFSSNNLGIATRAMFDEATSIAIVKVTNMFNVRIRILSGDEALFDSGSGRKSFQIGKGHHVLTLVDSDNDKELANQAVDIRGDCSLTIGYEGSFRSRSVRMWLDSLRSRSKNEAMGPVIRSHRIPVPEGPCLP